ncbi:YHS domain-containing protein [Alteromonadaceae bacterium M269]|nr:YHS domain-containing protein [Alteromonadaceae bacterium M269]
MKKIQLLVLALAWLVALPALAAKDAVNTKGFGNSAAIKGYDTVAYFTQSKAVKGSDEFTTQWHGATWQFSSQANLDLFKGNPEKYAPQYGGYCAWAMADGDGRTAGIDPDVWHIHEGKLYLNYNRNVQKEWLSTKLADIKVADRNYPNVTDVKEYN